jgi:hypothetical protein
MEEIDKSAFVVALEADERRVPGSADAGDVVLDVEERGPAIDGGVPLAQEVQIRAMDEEDRWAGHARTIADVRSGAAGRT